MNIMLSPPSGHTDSYLDVTFKIQFDQSVSEAKITVFNDTSKEPLDILGVIGGHIILERTAIFRNTGAAEGFINIFNKDKMNKKFALLRSVDIRFVAEMICDGKEITEEETVVFYNESMSLDAGIVPFDLILDNSEIDIEHGVPMGLSVISDTEKSYEICIKSEGSDNKCNFSIASQRGRTSIKVPAELIYSDLELEDDKNRQKRYQMYYVKREGVTFARLMNKKHIPIANTDLTFRLPKTLMPQAQLRKTPIGTELSEDFVLSDRYLVHTHKDFSSFGKKSDFHPKRLSYLTRFFHEAQSMVAKSQQKIKGMSIDGKPDLTEKSREVLRTESLRLQSRMKKAHLHSKDKEQIMQSFALPYEQKFGANVTVDLFYLMATSANDDDEKPVKAFHAPKSKSTPGCLPCSRRKRK